MNLTNFLLAVIATILCLRFFPNAAYTILALAVGGYAIYLCYWFIAVYPNQRRADKAARQREAENYAEFREYDAKHKAIRAKYDPNNEWNEATSLPREYEVEIRELNREYRAMLIERFGRDFVRDDDY